MDTTDLAVYRGLTRMRYALDGLLAVRVNMDELTPQEVALEAQGQATLEPVLADLYWWPLRNGIDQAPEDVDELRAWLEERYKSDAAVAALLALLLLFLRRGVNVGGAIGLELLGVGGAFNLLNADYLTMIDAHTGQLTTVGGDMSLVDTTIDDLVRGIPAARAGDSNTLLTLGAMIAGWAALRSVRIAATELARSVGNGLNWVYGRNDVARQAFQTRADDKVCAICSPLDGHEMDVDDIPEELRLPKHIMCRCYYAPILRGWDKPAVIWRGE